MAPAGGLALVARHNDGDTVTGVPMDNALRLAMQADPGEILITDAVRRDTRLNLQAEPAGSDTWRGGAGVNPPPELRQWIASHWRSSRRTTGTLLAAAANCASGTRS